MEHDQLIMHPLTMLMVKLIITVLRLGDHQFYGPGSEFVLDTTKPFTVVTQVLLILVLRQILMITKLVKVKKFAVFD